MIASSSLRQGARLAGEEQVLGELLADGGAAGDDLALLEVLLVGPLDRVPVEALVLHEVRVLGSDQGTLQVERDLVVGHPLVAQLGLRVLLLQRLQPVLHEGAAGGVEAVPPQHVREDPQ